MARRKALPKKKPTSYEFHRAKGRHQLVLYFEREDYQQIKAAAESEQRSVSQFLRLAGIRSALNVLTVAANQKRRVK